MLRCVFSPTNLGADMPLYTVRPITPDLRNAAYPLVQAAHPSLSLQSWLAYYDEVVDPMRFAVDQDEIAVAQDKAAYLRGLCISAPRRDLLHGRLLDVSAMIIPSIGDEQAIGSAIFSHLCEKMTRFECDAIRLRADQCARWVERLPRFTANMLRDDRLVVRRQDFLRGP